MFPRSEQRIYYFAFGANLSVDILKLRRITVYEVFDYVLEDAALRFTQYGFYKSHGYASADAVPGGKVYGRMYLIGESDALRMDYFEGVPFLGVHEKITHRHQGSPFYFYRAISPVDNLKPTQEYLDYLVTAYREMEDVPTDYIETMAATEVLDTFHPQNQTGEFVRNINQWPATFHPLLIKYEGFCNRVVEALWNRSLVDWMIRVRE